LDPALPGVLQDRLRASRAVSIPGIVLATLAGLTGVALGSAWLLSMTGLLYPPLPLTVHPKLMTFGFIYTFIAAVAYTLFPRLRNRDPGSNAALKVASLTLFSAGAWLYSFSSPHSPAWAYGAASALAGSTSYSIILAKLIGRPAGPLAAADPLLSTSTTLTPLNIALAIYSETQGLHPFTRHGSTQLLLLGPTLGTIMGVSIKTVHFRVSLRVMPRAWWLLSPCYALSCAAAIASYILQSPHLDLLSAAGFLTTSIIWALAVDAFRLVRSGEQYSRMNERDRARYRYFGAVFTVSSAWLLAGCAMALAASALTLAGIHRYWYGLRDGAIHSLSIGFIGGMIIAYAPILLPGLLSGKAPYRGLSLYPALLVNVGNVVRILWFLSGTPHAPYVSAVISSFYIGGAALFLHMVHALR